MTNCLFILNEPVLSNQIPIDFVAGSHGHFLETVLNKYFGIAEVVGGAFTFTGASHQVSADYIEKRLFWAAHWTERYKAELGNASKIISIKFDKDDLLLLSSVSLLRTGDFNINNDDLEIDTVEKLNNEYYQGVLKLLYTSYPFLNQEHSNIPRYILREFFKFGFRDPEINGYWVKQQDLKYADNCDVFYFEFKDFYNFVQLVSRIKQLELFLNRTFDFSTEFYKHYLRFIEFIPYAEHKLICDNIVSCVQQRTEVPIPKLTLFQESYINACLENIHRKEMPFHQDNYFTSTKDVLYYIDNIAPNL